MDVLTLDVAGVFFAFILAIMLFTFGLFTAGSYYLGMFYIATMLFFLVLSAFATWFGKERKVKMGLYQNTRSISNVVANGLAPLIFAVVAFFFSLTYWSSALLIPVIGFSASVAAVTADKFSSEIGVLDGTPTSIVTFRKIRKGESGGVTLLGLLAGALASIAVAVFVVLLASIPQYARVTGLVSDSAIFPALASVAIGGFIGTVVDSVLGHYEELGKGNKYTSNFGCSIAGGVAGIIIFLVLLL